MCEQTYRPQQAGVCWALGPRLGTQRYSRQPIPFAIQLNVPNFLGIWHGHWPSSTIATYESSPGGLLRMTVLSRISKFLFFCLPFFSPYLNMCVWRCDAWSCGSHTEAMRQHQQAVDGGAEKKKESWPSWHHRATASNPEMHTSRLLMWENGVTVPLKSGLVKYFVVCNGMNPNWFNHTSANNQPESRLSSTLQQRSKSQWRDHEGALIPLEQLGTLSWLVKMLKNW